MICDLSIIIMYGGKDEDKHVDRESRRAENVDRRE